MKRRTEMNDLQDFCGLIGDCANDLLGGGNACPLEDAVKVRAMLKDACDVMDTYIYNLATDKTIASHNLDTDTIRKVCNFFYYGKEEI
jgi:hypothetical protein